MNILFLLGNGFDLNLGMKTRYKQFYDNAYQIQPNDNDLVKGLKLAIKKDIETWADLETALGKYTKKLKNINEFDTVFDDIREKLAAYMSQQEKLYTYDTSVKNKFLEDMRFPYNFLTDGEKNIFFQFTSRFSSNQISVNAISFNYTNSLEKIINYKNEKLKIEKDTKMVSFFTGIEHIHGFTDNRFILGVDNIEQIENEAFRTEEDILNTIIKPRLNALAQHLCDERCKALIDSAQIICLFGLSIGSTDKTWWEYIGHRIQRGDVKLIIFWKGDEISSTFGDKILRAKKEVKEKFLSMTSLADGIKENISQHIHIGYNTEIFKVEKR